MEENKKPQTVNADLNENNLAVITHLLGLFTSFIGPLIMYLVYKDTATEKLRSHIIDALNWQISLIIYLIISSLLMIILIGFVGFFILTILSILFPILAALEANKGNHYKYPLTINFLK